MFEVVYRSSRLRISQLARSLSEEQLDTRVAGTPDWTALQVVAHLAGVAYDISIGNVEGVTTQPWTAAQVRARQGRSLEELLDEWNMVGPVVETRLAEPDRAPLPAYDVLTHEADLRENFGMGRVPAQDVDALLVRAGQRIVGNIKGAGTLVVRAGESEWTGGDGEPRTVVTVEPYEFFRAVFSRRSRKQMQRWQWEGDGDPAELIEKLPVFGARDDDQPIPE